MHQPYYPSLWRFLHRWHVLPELALTHRLQPELLAAVAWVEHQVSRAPDRVGWMRLPVEHLPLAHALGFTAEDLYWPDECLRFIARRLTLLREKHPCWEVVLAAHHRGWRACADEDLVDVDTVRYVHEVWMARDYLLMRQGLPLHPETVANACHSGSRPSTHSKEVMS